MFSPRAFLLAGFALAFLSLPATAQFRAGSVVVGPGGTTSRLAPYGLYGPYITRPYYVPTAPNIYQARQYGALTFQPGIVLPYNYTYVPRATTVIVQRPPFPNPPPVLVIPGGLSTTPPADDLQNPRSARLEVQVPANAQLWFEGVLTQQTGPVRQFVTPPLTPGQKYTYEVRIRWNDNGQMRERKENVFVAAGRGLVLDWTAPESESPAITGR